MSIGTIVDVLQKYIKKPTWSRESFQPSPPTISLIAQGEGNFFPSPCCVKQYALLITDSDYLTSTFILTGSTPILTK